jgi:S-DNA-T family DNA segregation ATPase FtsK/SpoIIIE
MLEKLKNFIHSFLEELAGLFTQVKTDKPSKPKADNTIAEKDHSDTISALQESFESKKNARALRQARLAEEEEAIREKHEKMTQMILDMPFEDDPIQENYEGDNSAIEIGEKITAKPVVEIAETRHQSQIQREKLYKLTKDYSLPRLSMLSQFDEDSEIDEEEINYQSATLQHTLDSFGIDAEVIGATAGPRVTLYKVLPSSGVKVESITQISNNIAMEMQALSLRILTPVPGRKYVGIEIPNRKATLIGVKNILNSTDWLSDRHAIPLVLGKSISGANVVLDLAKAPHLLIAGATGSGKSVCLNTMIMSMLYRFSPEDLRLILVDPKVVEFTVYKAVPHLVVPIVTDTQKVQSTLNWVIKEMELRYQILSKVGARNIASFNAREVEGEGETIDELWIPNKLPFLVVVIDELADVMMTARADVEVCLARIAQLSRAVGIHMIIATQRPSVNVITGIIKANFPTRIAFQVTSQIDSRTILDSKGAESLLGRGDMLYNPPGASGLQRIQGPFVTDKEVENVVEFTASQANQVFNMDVFEHLPEAESKSTNPLENITEKDEQLIAQAIEIIGRDQRASTSYIQRSLRIGYNRAAFIMDVLEDRGIVGPQIGSTPREIFTEN